MQMQIYFFLLQYQATDQAYNKHPTSKQQAHSNIFITLHLHIHMYPVHIEKVYLAVRSCTF